MSNWSEGYVVDVEYTYGYFDELNTNRVKLAFLNAGLRLPEFVTACELGFGQGLSTNIHSAASMTTWFGTDFLPAQASYAQELSSASKGNCHLYDQSFDEFCAREDLPEFDYIGLHGIWSWISDENRKTIVDFISRKLKVGGVLYISYNTMPGWTQMLPVRYLLTEHGQIMSSKSDGIASKVNQAIDFLEKIVKLSPSFAQSHPQLQKRLDKIKGEDPNYVAHEYFNKNWLPIHFGEMAKWLEPAKVDYACTANFIDLIDAINITNEQSEVLKNISDLVFRETVRDFLINQQFRRDYWVKGARRLPLKVRIDQINNLRVILNKSKTQIELTVDCQLGRGTLNAEIYEPILNILADNKIHKISEIQKLLKSKIGIAEILQVITIMAGKGDLQLAQDEQVIENSRENSQRLNRKLLEDSQNSAKVNYLTSPVTGGGVTVSRIEQIYLYSILMGKSHPKEWASDAWNVISSEGLTMKLENEPVIGEDKNIKLLVEQATKFSKDRLPILMELGVI